MKIKVINDKNVVFVDYGEKYDTKLMYDSHLFFEGGIIRKNHTDFSNKKINKIRNEN